MSALADTYHTAYGLDLSSSHLVIVKAQKNRKETTCTTIYDGTNDKNDAQLQSVISAIITEEMVLSSTVSVGALPVAESITRRLNIPLSSPKKAEKVVPSLLDVQLPFPLEECTYTVLEKQQTDSGHIDILTLAARQDSIRNRIDLYAQSGLNPTVMDHEGLALWEYTLKQHPLGNDKTRIILFIGYDRTILVTGTDQHYLHAHTIRTGIAELFSSSEQNAQATAQFQQKARQLLQARGPINQEVEVYLAGPGAKHQDCHTLIQSMLSIFSHTRVQTFDASPTLLAEALAVRQLKANTLFFDFRSGPFEHPSRSRRNHLKFNRLLISCLVIGLLLSGLNITWQQWLKHSLKKEQLALTSLASSLTDMPPHMLPKGQEVLITEREMAIKKEQITPFLDVFNESLYLVLTDILSIASDYNIVLETLSLKSTSISLKGTSPDWDHCDMLLTFVRAKGFDATLDRQDAGADERVHFSIQGETR